jgi:hypothetical protein
MKEFKSSLAALNLALTAISVYCLFNTDDRTAVTFGFALIVVLLVAVVLAEKTISLPGFPVREATDAELEKIAFEFWGSVWKRKLFSALSKAARYGVGAYMIFGGIGLVPLGVGMVSVLALTHAISWMDAP